MPSTSSNSPKGALRARYHYAMWMFTAACPSRCTYCDLDSQKRLGTLERAEVERVANELVLAGFSEVMFAGGEPLLSPDLPAALAALRGKVPTAVFTGGLPGLQARALEVLREGGVDRLVCSIDSGDDARNDRLRGRPGITRELVALIELLREELPRLSRSINTVVSRFNIETVGDVWQRLSRYGFDVWALTLAGDFFETAHPHALADAATLERYYLETVPALARDVEASGAKLVVLPIPFPLLEARTPPSRWGEAAASSPALRAEIVRELELYARGEFNRTFVERVGCPLVGIDVVIGVGGQIHPCSQAPIIKPEYVIGNVKTEALASILEGEALRRFGAGVPHAACTRCWAPSNVPPRELVQLLSAWRARESQRLGGATP